MIRFVLEAMNNDSNLVFFPSLVSAAVAVVSGFLLLLIQLHLPRCRHRYFVRSSAVDTAHT